MADFAGYLMSIQDQNCKILKRVSKIEKHLFLQSKEETKDLKIENSIIKVIARRKNLKPNKQTGKNRKTIYKNSNFTIKKIDDDFNIERLEEKVFKKDVT